MSEYAKPLPVPTVESKAFWEGCRRHELLLPCCAKCGHWWFPPGPTCPNCWSMDWEWKKTSGRGKIYSFGVYHRVYHKGFEHEMPYVLAVVQLDEGPRLVTNVVDGGQRNLECGLPVEVIFEDVTDDTTLYKFRPL
jgi:uncharacterized OB-fold protein